MLHFICSRSYLFTFLLPSQFYWHIRLKSTACRPCRPCCAHCMRRFAAALFIYLFTYLFSFFYLFTYLFTHFTYLLTDWLTDLLTYLLTYHWKCVRGHWACAESRDPWVGVKQLHFWNSRPRFAYSLYNFNGSTMKVIKVICENNSRPSVKLSPVNWVR